MAPKVELVKETASATVAEFDRQPSSGGVLMNAGDLPKTTGRSLAPQGTRGQVLAQAECYVALDGRKISTESELADRRFVQLVKRPGHPRFVLYVHPPVDAGPNDDPVVLDLDPDTPLWLMRPADATRVGAAPESGHAATGLGGVSAATAAAVAEAAGRPLVLYDFELSYSRKQAEQAVKRASSSGAGGASSGGAPNPFAGGGGGGGASSSGGGAFAKLFGCFKKPEVASTPAAPPADPAAAAQANATAAAAVAATGVQPGTPRTPQSLARIKEALLHAGVPSHKKVRLAFEDEVLAKTWHSLVALTLGYVSPTQQGATRGTQSSLAAYQ